MFGALVALILTILSALFATLAWPIRALMRSFKDEEPDSEKDSDCNSKEASKKTNRSNDLDQTEENSGSSEAENALEDASSSVN